MKTLVFFLEEISARELLIGVLPTIVPADVEIRYVVFEGKQDMEANLARKIRHWKTPETSFVVLRDKDAGDCVRVKTRLQDLVRSTGRDALIRIACRELEAWVAGDLQAVAEAFDIPRIADLAKKAKFRDPDRLGDPFGELRLVVPNYQKVSGAREVGGKLDPARNLSTSFQAFCHGVRRIVA